MIYPFAYAYTFCSGTHELPGKFKARWRCSSTRSIKRSLGMYMKPLTPRTMQPGEGQTMLLLRGRGVWQLFIFRAKMSKITLRTSRLPKQRGRYQKEREKIPSDRGPIVTGKFILCLPYHDERSQTGNYLIPSHFSLSPLSETSK